jgi:WD40 repeat protein
MNKQLPAGTSTPAQHLADLWRRGQAPEIQGFLAELSEVGPDEVLAVLRIDQAERWRRGQRIPAEAYLVHWPDLERDDERSLDLIYSEIVLRQGLGETPRLEEYVQRFPRCAGQLQRQFALDRAMNWDSLLHPDAPSGGPGADASDTVRPPGFGAGPPDATPLLSDPPSGSVATRTTVPGYVIQEELGRGGMGVVYRAEQVRLKRPVALKMILAGEHAGAQELARFRQEAEAVAHLQHPNIVQIYEVGEHDGRPYFSLELVEGGSLAARLNGTPLPSRLAAELVETLARAIDHAHQRGIIHRDLKPGNVLLQSVNCKLQNENLHDDNLQFAFCILHFAIPKITDFGLAKRLDVASLATNSGQILGTPSYMAPEQASGKEVGPAADIYALGAVLYELLTGRPPFKAATTLDTVMQVVGDEPVAPRRLQPRVPRDLEIICLKCLEKDARRRYASAAALADDLRRFLDQKPIRARPAGPVVRFIKAVRRRPALATLGLVLAIGVILAFAGVLWHLGEVVAERQRVEVERQRVEEQKQRTQAALHQAEINLYLNHIALAAREWSAGNVDRAQQLLHQCPPRLRNWEWHYLKRLCHLELHTFTGAGGFGVAFSPDGRRVASASMHERAVEVLNARTGKVLHRFRNSGPAVAFSADGQRLASAELHLGKMGNVLDKEPCAVKVWDLKSGRQVLSLEGPAGHESAVWAIAFSPDRLHLASAGWDGKVKIWNAQTGDLERTLNHGPWVRVESLSFDRTGQRLATATRRQITVWAPLAGRILTRFDVQLSELDRVGTGFRASRSDKGESFKAEGVRPRDWDSTRKVWDATCSTEILTARGQTHQVAAVAFSPDDQWLAFARGDTVKVLSATGNQPWREMHTLRGHTDLVRALAFTPDGKRLASGSYDKSIKVWDLESGGELFTLRGHTDPINGLAYSPDGTRLASAGWDRTVRIWPAVADPEARTLKAHDRLVRSVAYSPDGRFLASAGADYQIKLFPRSGRGTPVVLTGHTDLVRNIVFSRDSQWLASASYDGKVIVWDVAHARPTLTYQRHSNRVFAAVFSPDGRRVASAGIDGVVRVWDRRTGKDILSFRGHTTPHRVFRVHALAYSPDGRHIASAGDDRVVRVCDADSGDEILALGGHTRDIMYLAYSPDGRLLASAGLDRTIRIYEADTGRKLPVLDRHTEAVIGLAFSPDCSRLASASMDRTVKLWVPATGQEALTLRGSMLEVFSVGFSPDGRQLASGNTDGTIKIWEGAP